jgi:hypothetical protein
VGAGSATHPVLPGGGLGQHGHWRSGVAPLLRLALLLLALVAVLVLPTGCDRLSPTRAQPEAEIPLRAQGPAGRLQEVAPPAAVQQLQAALADHDPQVSILAPRDGAVLPAGPVTLQLQVRDWPLVDAGPLGLGPHVVLLVDDQPPLPVTGLKVELPGLTPGSHRITAYAARPWGEAVKSPGASAQIRVQRVAANPLAIPQPGTPQLLVVSPESQASREPVLLDWLLLDAPLQGLRDNDGSWRLRVTVNGDSFLVDQNAPLWLKGWERGSNSLLLELVDGRGDPLNPPFNSVVSELVLDPSTPGPIWQQGRLTASDLAHLLGTAPPETPAAPTPPTEPTAPPQAPPVAPAVEAEPLTEPPADPEPTSEPTLEVLPPPAAAPIEQTREASEEDVGSDSEPAGAALAEPSSALEPGPTPEETSPAPPRAATIPAAATANPDRIVPSSSVEGSARNQVNPDGSLLKPRPSGPLAGLRQKLGA